MIVHDIRQMISRQLVSTLIEHLVVKDVTLHADLTTNQIVDKYFLPGINLKTNHILLAISYHLLYFLFRKSQGVAHLTARMAVVLEVLYLLTLGIQFLRSIECNIGFARVQ